MSVLHKKFKESRPITDRCKVGPDEAAHLRRNQFSNIHSNPFKITFSKITFHAY